MFPYLTTGLKKVWAAITALQSSLANVQSSLANVQSGAVQFLDYDNVSEITISANGSSRTIVNGGLIIFRQDGSGGVGINVNGNFISSFRTDSNASSIEFPLYFKGGESVYINLSGSPLQSRSFQYIPFKTS